MDLFVIFELLHEVWHVFFFAKVDIVYSILNIFKRRISKQSHLGRQIFINDGFIDLLREIILIKIGKETAFWQGI